jgi:hypothetical protein
VKKLLTGPKARYAAGTYSDDQANARQDKADETLSELRSSPNPDRTDEESSDDPGDKTDDTDEESEDSTDDIVVEEIDDEDAPGEGLNDEDETRG